MEDAFSKRSWVILRGALGSALSVLPVNLDLKSGPYRSVGRDPCLGFAGFLYGAPSRQPVKHLSYHVVFPAAPSEPITKAWRVTGSRVRLPRDGGGPGELIGIAGQARFAQAVLDRHPVRGPGSGARRQVGNRDSIRGLCRHGRVFASRARASGRRRSQGLV